MFLLPIPCITLCYSTGRSWNKTDILLLHIRCKTASYMRRERKSPQCWIAENRHSHLSSLSSIAENHKNKSCSNAFHPFGSGTIIERLYRKQVVSLNNSWIGCVIGAFRRPLFTVHPFRRRMFRKVGIYSSDKHMNFISSQNSRVIARKGPCISRDILRHLRDFFKIIWPGSLSGGCLRGPASHRIIPFYNKSRSPYAHEVRCIWPLSETCASDAFEVLSLGWYAFDAYFIFAISNFKWYWLENKTNWTNKKTAA